jgi:FkbM family methyltransferase
MKDRLYSALDRLAPFGRFGDAALLRQACADLAIDRLGGIHLIDIGAAGDIPPRFAPVQPYIAYTGFEPDDRSRAELLQKRTECLSYRILPEAIGADFGEITLRLTRGAVFTSAFEPNRALLDRFPDSGKFDVVDRAKIPVVPLDSLRLEHCDFIKTDIQGGELDTLRGGTDTLARCFGFEVEVEFLPLYEGQPLFADVSAFAAECGFEFIDFLRLGRWSRDRQDRLGQCLYGDALFLRSPEWIAEQADGRGTAIYLALLMAYRRYDLARTMLALLPRDHPARSGRFPTTLAAAAKRQGRLSASLRAALRVGAGDTPGYLPHLFY